MVENKNDTEAASRDFESLYLSVRHLENRLYSDRQVKLLPETEPGDARAGEWRIRKRSAARLFKYLIRKNAPLEILEVGCGNGWLSAKLSAIPASSVTGIDINRQELQQAARVFQNENLRFGNTSILRDNFSTRFNQIVFAASIQYFPLPGEVLARALTHLAPGGEIHIIDSFFYDDDTVVRAAERSSTYYQNIGKPEMAAHYFHHSFSLLGDFNCRMLFDPRNPVNRVLHRKDIFPWICIAAT